MATATQPLSGVYSVDPVHSSFGFAVKYMGVTTFKGTLDDVDATLTVTDGVAQLDGAAVVESISIRTPEQFRQHVLGDEFFAVEQHPHVTFSSDSVTLADDGSVTVGGRLTIRGVTKPVTATGTWSPEAELFGQRKAALAIAATVDRTDFGLNWNADLPTGGKALADDVTLTIELTLVAQGAGAGD
ncbi:YceI family protein [Conexibacter woesei]|uniref:YceI family protein n=1 Tax=Conexibacter woesei (strain DSM 14684 / CCUG 47730 / CIP 108061 / JCM 11494 / NBRC 100937 / ID131577) TaxID=469383 RepID=D3FFH0_CONWI|nr:YceI family protein [Conexibacter woesei]ADB53763.1 YceI family protein [Conexibacter woesei DSM 14684]